MGTGLLRFARNDNSVVARFILAFQSTEIATHLSCARNDRWVVPGARINRLPSPSMIEGEGPDKGGTGQNPLALSEHKC